MPNRFSFGHIGISCRVQEDRGTVGIYRTIWVTIGQSNVYVYQCGRLLHLKNYFGQSLVTRLILAIIDTQGPKISLGYSRCK